MFFILHLSASSVDVFYFFFVVYRHKDDLNLTINMSSDVLRISTKHKVQPKFV